MGDLNNKRFNTVAFLKHFERRVVEPQKPYFDTRGAIHTFYYDPATIITHPDNLYDPLVLKGTDEVTLLFLIPCKLFNPYLTTRQAEVLKELAQQNDLPRYLGFFNYTEYRAYFEDRDLCEVRLRRVNQIVADWVTKTDTMPLEFRRIFKDQAAKKCFDIVPADTIAYVPPSPGGTIELPSWINPDDDSQWPQPSHEHYAKMRSDGWLFHFPKPTTHTVLKLTQKYDEVLFDEDTTTSEMPLYDRMKHTTAAALTLFEKEVTTEA